MARSFGAFDKEIAMITISATNRAKAVAILLQEGRPFDIQCQLIAGAIREATEQAALIAESHNDHNEFDTITKLIARDIRNTK